jgi:hypothetical protein
MGRFLRDEVVKDITIDVDNIVQIAEVFIERNNSLNPEYDPENNGTVNSYLTYIIRVDNKGCRLFNLEELLRYFDSAKEVERIIFTVETRESMSSNRAVGQYLELRLDAKEPKNSILAVTADDKDWVDASFSAVKEVLNKCKNNNGWARTPWTELFVQLAGVILCFTLSLWAATIIAPKLAIANPFVFSFIFILLIISNTWTYLNRLILWAINKSFPSIRFSRPNKQRLQWVMQAVIGGIIVAFVLYTLSILFSFFVDILSGFVKTSQTP